MCFIFELPQKRLAWNPGQYRFPHGCRVVLLTPLQDASSLSLAEKMTFPYDIPFMVKDLCDLKRNG